MRTASTTQWSSANNMNIDWHKVFTVKFFFQLDREAPHRVDWAVLYFGGALVLIWLIIWVVTRKASPVNKELWRKIGRLTLTIGLLEAFWFGLRYEGAQWFGTRATAAAFVVIGLIWLGFIIKYYFSMHRVKKRAWEKEQIKLKYL